MVSLTYVVLAGWIVQLVQAKGQGYILSPPVEGHYVSAAYNQNSGLLDPANVIPFRQLPSGFLPNKFQNDRYQIDVPRDLQTSDLPLHLQQTLPQYRFSNIRQGHDDTPSGLHENQFIPPSTHRPNYFHLFSRSHSKDPPQTEIFLDDVTLEKPVDSSLQFQDFKENDSFPIKPQAYDNFKRSNREKVQGKQNILNHGNVIFAPEDENIDVNLETNNYFISENREVYITKSPPLYSIQDNFKSTTARVANVKVNKKMIPQTSVINDFDNYSLPEETNEDINNKKRNSDFIKEVKKKHQKDELFTTTATSKINQKTHEIEYSEEEYDLYKEKLKNKNFVENEGLKREGNDESRYDLADSKNSSSTFQVITMKPALFIEDHNFDDFVDILDIDTTTQEAQTSIKMIDNPIVVSTSSMKIKNGGESINKEVQQKFPPIRADDSQTLVVSVVTSKTVVNNTLTPLVLSSPYTKNNNSDKSTESWMVVASVKTSSSVSGPRYITSPKSEQERIELLNNEKDDDMSTTDYSSETHRGESTSAPAIFNKNDNSTNNTLASAKAKTSTESLIDKLDRVQSNLFSGLLTGRFKNEENKLAVINESQFNTINATKRINATVSTEVPLPDRHSTAKNPYPQVHIRKYSPGNRLLSTIRPKRVFETVKQSNHTYPGQQRNSKNHIDSIFAKAKPVEDISALLPPGFKLQKSKDIPPTIYQSNKGNNTSTGTIDSILAKAKLVEDISALLPPEFKSQESKDVLGIPPTIYKSNKGKNLSNGEVDSILAKAKPAENISALLPPGYKSTIYKSNKANNPLKVPDLLKTAIPVDISSFLPPGYKPQVTLEIPESNHKIETIDVQSSFFQPGLNDNIISVSTTTEKPVSKSKVVFPSRPGGGPRKISRLSTPKPVVEDPNKPTLPTIRKGWPSRSTTEFTGWPTPPTTPISVEKLLEAARIASTSTSTEEPTVTTMTTTTTTTTTTTPRPTTPGICMNQCDLAGTIKLVGGAKWVPELLDRNTREWQILANEVETQLEQVFTKSPVLSKWYKKIRIDGFSEGSVLVDYLVEVIDSGKKINTLEIKKLFHESLTDATKPKREPKFLNDTSEKTSFGNFTVDLKFTDFVVIPKSATPTVGYAEGNVVLPQWAIAVIVIGLASLLFVIIFGVTVLINRQKISKKKSPTPLTEDMLSELNKNHMGGIDNYGAEDLYNMEDVWTEHTYRQKSQKMRSNGSFQDNSMSNLYDSWKSEWNGYYFNVHGGNIPGSNYDDSYSGKKKSDYDTNF